MTTAIARQQSTAETLERVLLNGDLSSLKPEDRVAYYKQVCDSLGLNPLTKPFDYITLNGKLTLYAKKDCADQLREKRCVSIVKLERERIEDIYTVTAYATDTNQRQDSSIGAVNISNLKGDALANAIMKAETKAKRRVTLSICGLGMLDETEIETIPQRAGKGQLIAETKAVEPDMIDGEVADDATPEQRRQEKVDHVIQLGKWLNDHNDDIKWSGKTTHDYINQMFDVEDGLNSLDFESLDQLIAQLTERLGMLQMPA